MSEIITIKNLKKTFADGVEVLKDISFTVEKAKFLELLVQVVLENLQFYDAFLSLKL